MSDKPDFKTPITEMKGTIQNGDLPTGRPLRPKDKDKLVKKLKGEKVVDIEGNEILKLTTKINISTPDKLKNFEEWKEKDGTLKGLKEVYNKNKVDDKKGS